MNRMGKRQRPDAREGRRTIPQGQVEIETHGGVRSRKLGRLLVLLVLLVLSLPVLWFAGVLAITPRAKAQQAIAGNHLDRAEYWLRWADRLSYRDSNNALLAARIARHRGEPAELKSQLQRAQAWGADRDRVERERMLALAQVGELDQVETQLVNWLVQPGSEADEISDAYANGLAATGRFAEAMNVLDAWRRDFPNDPRCDYRIGRIQEHREMYDDAEASYLKSLGKAADFYPARFSLGRVLLHQRRSEEALAQFEICMAMPHPQAAMVEAAVALKALGRADQARPLLLRVLENSREEIEASYRAVEEQPEGFRPAAEYGRLESDAGNFEAALPWLEAALEANPQDLTVRYSLGVTLRGLGKMDQAEGHFEHVRAARERMGAATALNSRIQADPTDLEARLRLGQLILENESERMGLYWVRSIFSYDPDYRPAHRILAEYYAGLAAENAKYAKLARYHRDRSELAPSQDTTTQEDQPQ
jgi:tetratricopeptide (TPR) repeat protein